MNRSFELSLVVPCLNEEGNVLELAERFLVMARSEQIEAEIVFVDDGSTDETCLRIDEAKLKFPNRVAVVRHSQNQGIPKAWKSGVAATRGTAVCLIDGDLQNRPEDAVKLFQELTSSGADLVRGVRIPATNVPWSRTLMSKLLNKILNLTFAMTSSDNKSGFVVASREVMIQLTSPRANYNHYQTFIGVAAKHLDLNVIEIDTVFEDRRSGVSFLTGSSWRVTRKVIADIFIAKREFSTAHRKVTSS